MPRRMVGVGHGAFDKNFPLKVLTDTGPNLPAGMAELFKLDTSRSDQTIINTNGSEGTVGETWHNPETNPDHGAFFNIDSGEDVAAVDIRWKSGTVGWAGFYTWGFSEKTELYVRCTYFVPSDFTWSGGTVKIGFFKSNPGGSNDDINTAPKLESGSIATMNLKNMGTEFDTTSSDDAPNGQWNDVEFRLKLNTVNAEDAEIDMWIDGALVGSTTVAKFTNNDPLLPFVKVQLLGYYGGQATTPDNSQYVRFRRLVIWGK